MGATFCGSSSSNGDSGIQVSCDVIFNSWSPWLPLGGNAVRKPLSLPDLPARLW